ncbi:autoinducer binding domain-containing protein [Neisseriaceae bacterium TC5R-5]|nr:autoinducer binding domain-containing protein [Neisseriaceae bacterium TC5R-5]
MDSILEEKIAVATSIAEEPIYNVMAEINRLKYWQTKAEAAQHVKKIVRALGAENFIYMLILPPGLKTLSRSFHFLIGCDAEFCRIYSERMWHLNDPFLNYAHKNTLPQLNSVIIKHTPGQVEMAECGAHYGLRSGLVIPTHFHMAAAERIGLFYVGSSLEQDIGESVLAEHQAEFAALATGVCWWWCLYLKRQAMQKFDINEQEVVLLEQAKNGCSAEAMAALQNVSTAVIYRRLTKVKDKLDVTRIERAVIEAQSVGLIE